jgi:hypothetical protein
MAELGLGDPRSGGGAQAGDGYRWRRTFICPVPPRGGDRVYFVFAFFAVKQTTRVDL